MKLNSRETRANKIMHWNRFETRVKEYFLKRGKGTSPFCNSFFFDNERGAFSIEYDLADHVFKVFQGWRQIMTLGGVYSGKILALDFLTFTPCSAGFFLTKLAFLWGKL